MSYLWEEWCDDWPSHLLLSLQLNLNQNWTATEEKQTCPMEPSVFIHLFNFIVVLQSMYKGICCHCTSISSPCSYNVKVNTNIKRENKYLSINTSNAMTTESSVHSFSHSPSKSQTICHPPLLLVTVPSHDHLVAMQTMLLTS